MNKFEKAASLIIEAYNCYTAHVEEQLWEIPGLIAIIWATPEGLGAKHEAWGFIQDIPEGLNVVFRGTESSQDWINNAELSFGWDELYTQFGPRVVEFLTANSHLPINIYAHSAGCCLAKRLIRDLDVTANSALIAAPKDTVKVSCTVANNIHDIVPKSPALRDDYFQTGDITEVDFFHVDPVACHSIYNYQLEFRKLNI